MWVVKYPERALWHFWDTFSVRQNACICNWALNYSDWVITINCNWALNYSALTSFMQACGCEMLPCGGGVGMHPYHSPQAMGDMIQMFGLICPIPLCPKSLMNQPVVCMATYTRFLPRLLLLPQEGNLNESGSTKHYIRHLIGLCMLGFGFLTINCERGGQDFPLLPWLLPGLGTKS